jgi:tetratricopeptide (TPR) repeat protein
MKALKLLVSCLLPLALSAQQPSGNVGRVEIPDVKGVLEINVGQSPWYLDFLPEDKWTMLHARLRPDHVVVTALLRQVTLAATGESCKNEFLPKIKDSLAGKAQDTKESTQNGVFRVEYTLTDDLGAPTRHLLAYWGARDLCAEVHVLKTGFAAADQAAFEQILSSVRLLPDESGLQTPQSQENSSNLLAQGTEVQAKADYGSAARYYQKALDLEKRTRSFDQEMFLDLISRLALCYRLNGNLVKARQTLEFGLSQDAEYPLFHYDMACVYARMGKMDESLGQLREAYKYKAKASPGHLPPDPTEDSCFQKFANDPQFTDAVQKMQQQ